MHLAEEVLHKMRDNLRIQLRGLPDEGGDLGGGDMVDGLPVEQGAVI
jgi:hypothetical protein